MTTIDDFRDQANLSPIVLIVGSGISIWADSNIPSGKAFVKQYFQILFGGKNIYFTKNEKSSLFTKFKKLPFEVINAQCPNKKAIRDLIIFLCKDTKPNPIHNKIVDLLATNQISTVITPNYDVGIEKAIEQYNTPNTKISVTRIVKKNEKPKSVNKNVKYLFKLHGSVDYPRNQSLIYLLNQEGKLLEWKRNLLHELLENQISLLVGYSGSDFDICPEIASANVKHLYWNFRSRFEARTTYNIDLISKNKQITKIISDMRDTLNEGFTGGSIPPLFQKTDPKIIYSFLHKHFSEIDVKSWQINVLKSLSYCKKAIPILKDALRKPGLSINTKIYYESSLGEMLHTQGKYLSAAIRHYKISKISSKIKSKNVFTQNQLLLASDNWRCFGNMLFSQLCLNRVKKYISQNKNIPLSLFANEKRLELLILGNYLQFLDFINLKKYVLKIQFLAITIINSVVEAFKQKGEEYPYAQLLLWTEKFKLTDAQIKMIYFPANVSVLKKYQQLNFPMGESIAFREECKRAKYLSLRNFNNLTKYRQQAITLGINAEVWKLNALIIRKFKNYRTNEIMREFWKYFLRCQYDMLFSFFQFLRGD